MYSADKYIFGGSQMEINHKIIGQRIRDARIKKGLSHAALAEKIDRSVPFISHIETALTPPGLETLIRIANVPETTVNTLLSGNQINDPLEYHYELVKIIYKSKGIKAINSEADDAEITDEATLLA